MQKLLSLALFALLLSGGVVAQDTEVVTTEGVADIVSANAFRLLSPTNLEVGEANVLVFPDTAGGFAIDINNGIGWLWRSRLRHHCRYRRPQLTLYIKPRPRNRAWVEGQPLPDCMH